LHILGNRSRSIDESLKKYEKLLEKESNNLQAKIRKNSKPDRVRGLINPFYKSQSLVKLTSNRRRWSHIFPESTKYYNKIKQNINLLNLYLFLELSKTQRFFDDFEFIGNAEMDLSDTDKKEKFKKMFCMYLYVYVMILNQLTF